MARREFVRSGKGPEGKKYFKEVKPAGNLKPGEQPADSTPSFDELPPLEGAPAVKGSTPVSTGKSFTAWIEASQPKEPDSD